MRSLHKQLTKVCAQLLCVAALGGIVACSDDNTAGKDAVAIGGTFEFYSPDGKQEIFYPEDERSPIADFSGPALMDENTTIKLSDFAGQVVVLNAWGQWCAPCRSESDDLQEVQEFLAKHNGTVLGINVRDFDPETSRDFVQNNGLSYPSIYDPPFKTAAQLGGVPASVVPTTIILDKQHRPAAVFLREITAKDVLDVVKPLVEA
ncbi:TlpA family protein disulfide reductase [Corynebacterium sp. sy017]|uniref:TlpA disulfide reductase family protein n=1 Tax=unclassified Corynebacterium TaxID=2624378 RepID=UPI001184E1D9|nr:MULTISPECIES: TlpA disulfide reductase family protein [unclassified Corynebacterium]MBP3089306.1 TlpA family protein disulfide reductase [Corynebacterium sp. sy017]QDZ43243.1 TlpA family protein disulfide reductase [Corynebacterium sp. sy039]TSD90994.1 TlpA family protein disulfide reductase [Corynebacterium sp. SY003]